MLFDILLLTIGALIGWNFPQPTWARIFTDWIKEKYSQWHNN